MRNYSDLEEFLTQDPSVAVGICISKEEAGEDLALWACALLSCSGSRDFRTHTPAIPFTAVKVT